MKIQILLLVMFPTLLSLGQKEEKTLSEIILSKDSLFWYGYNTCQYELMSQFLDKNVEFYHDKGGLIIGAEKVIEATRKNICGMPNIRVLRVAIPKNIIVYPLEQNGQVYGAVLSGDHYFYQNGLKTGIAKFTHTWLLKEDHWQMHRILSFDHQSATDHIFVNVTEQDLKSFVGEYSSPQFGQVVITLTGKGLTLENEGKKMELRPMNKDTFFIEGRNIEFRFIKGLKFEVVENGKLVDEVKFIK